MNGSFLCASIKLSPAFNSIYLLSFNYMSYWESHWVCRGEQERRSLSLSLFLLSSCPMLPCSLSSPLLSLTFPSPPSLFQPCHSLPSLPRASPPILCPPSLSLSSDRRTNKVNNYPRVMWAPLVASFALRTPCQHCWDFLRLACSLKLFPPILS